MSKKWTDEEIKILKEYFPQGGTKLCILNGLNRPKDSIRGKANKLGIKLLSNKNYLNYREDMWSAEEYAILSKYYPLGGAKLCIEKGLNRSKNAIKSRAKMKGISSESYYAQYWSELEVDLLKKYYPIGGVKLCIAKGLNRTEAAIKEKIRQYYPKDLLLHLTRTNKHVYSWTDEELSILQKYYPKGCSKLCIENGLYRTPVAICSKAKIVGVQVEDMGNIISLKDSTWSEEELELLQTYYPKGGAKLCIEKGLNRTYLSIKTKADISEIRVVTE